MVGPGARVDGDGGEGGPGPSWGGSVLACVAPEENVEFSASAATAVGYAGVAVPCGAGGDQPGQAAAVSRCPPGAACWALRRLRLLGPWAAEGKDDAGLGVVRCRHDGLRRINMAAGRPGRVRHQPRTPRGAGTGLCEVGAGAGDLVGGKGSEVGEQLGGESVRHGADFTGGGAGFAAQGRDDSCRELPRLQSLLAVGAQRSDVVAAAVLALGGRPRAPEAAGVPVVPGRPAGGRGRGGPAAGEGLDRTEAGWCGSSRSGTTNTPPPAAKPRNPYRPGRVGACRVSGGTPYRRGRGCTADRPAGRARRPEQGAAAAARQVSAGRPDETRRPDTASRGGAGRGPT